MDACAHGDVGPHIYAHCYVYAYTYFHPDACFADGSRMALELAHNPAEGYTGPPRRTLRSALVSITMADVAQLSTELEAAGNTYTIEVYSGAPHAHTVLGSERYQDRADTQSWAAFSAFLNRHLGDE